MQNEAAFPNSEFFIPHGAPVSGISPRVEQELLSRGLLDASALPGRYLLSELTANRQPLPSLDVAIIRRLDRLLGNSLSPRLGGEGEGEGALVLGLDFLTHFERIHFHTRSLRLVLDRF